MSRLSISGLNKIRPFFLWPTKIKNKVNTNIIFSIKSLRKAVHTYQFVEEGRKEEVKKGNGFKKRSVREKERGDNGNKSWRRKEVEDNSS